ncbi:Hint domain-containing protein [Paracoccus sp. JM45]|uniref:Hint domain-containing protein n=1 Tax=Paracoccus sp. JM45 TaxID=2283626 RepID=UPI001600BC84|nr:Hint domain-containing protein [Paracoccus sp. JM45]
MAFISELHFRGSGVANSGEFVEITLGPDDNPDDFVVSVYDDDGTLSTGAGISGGEVNLGTLTGTVHPDDPDFTIYVISVGVRNSTSDSNEGSGIALTNVDTSTVLSFYSANSISAFAATEGAANGTTSDNILDHLSAQNGESYQWDIKGNLTFATIDAGGSVLCLAGNARVQTKHGKVHAEDLQVGDMVWTANHGFQPVQWIGKTRLSSEYLSQNHKQRPIFLAKDSIAPGFPQSGLALSRQHRVLISSPVAERMTGHFEVLVPAVKLLEFDGIDIELPTDGITYVHLLFRQHEIIAADGALVESLLLTDHVGAMTTGIEHNDQTASKPARPILDNKRAQQLIRRIIKNQRPLYEPRVRRDFGPQAA